MPATFSATTRSASYVAFDILWADGTDLRCLPLSERRKRLQAILPEGSPIVSEALSGVLAVSGMGWGFCGSSRS